MSSSFELDSGGDPLIGQRLGGKYTIERLIGRGGMGHVYSATALEGGSTRDVVVKMIAPPLAQQPQALARFEREAKRLDGLRHSNIVEMYDYGREGGRAYIVMEFVDGELLSDEGATLVEAKTYRLTPHSSDDDDRSYRSREEVEAGKAREPLARYPQLLMERGLLTEAKIGEFEARAKAEVDAAQQAAEAAPYPDPEETLADVYAPLEEY
jgi:hypothetical protein